MQKPGRFLPVHHLPEAIFFRFQLEEELAQAVRLRQMRFGRLRPGKGRDAAQHLRFPGHGAGAQGIVHGDFLPQAPVRFAPPFGRKGPRRKLSLIHI